MKPRFISADSARTYSLALLPLIARYLYTRHNQLAFVRLEEQEGAIGVMVQLIHPLSPESESDFCELSFLMPCVVEFTGPEGTGKEISICYRSMGGFIASTD